MRTGPDPLRQSATDAANAARSASAAAAARAPASVTVAINAAAEGATAREVDVRLHRREDGGFHATRGGGARDAMDEVNDDDELEVLRLFGSALYVNAGDL